MILNSNERKEFYSYTKEIISSDNVQKMRKYIQHGKTSTYTHCLSVAILSYWICRRFNLKLNIKSLLIGALLHDFYLYDWHIKDENRKGLHGFTHPKTSLKNADKYFSLSPLEKDIIEKHMWPLTITDIPKYPESFIVSIADKICSIKEIFNI